ncbi:uncharacterized protein LOC116053255 isoform X2 [Sander lucioperca]|uniref:uncharacterized protein LOC116053255 isoform X2 n=1 Tax=Sander lucioperca TaxID=283035 RepID=UPI001653EBD8|nr:uncharacterized protein LOC116053255 isoform X2 [Sander lucioperca]
MDPMFSLPEIIPSDREEPASTQSGSPHFSYFSSHYHQLVPAPQEEPDIHRLSEPSFQTSQVGQFCPPEPYLVTGESVLLRTPTVADLFQRRANPDHRADALYWTQRDSNQQCVQHLIPSLAGSIQPQAQDCPSSFNVLPGVCPQTLPPDARFQPGFTPLLPEVIVTPGCSSYFLVPISSPPECCCSGCSPPHSWLLLPEVRPSWCLCPQAVPVHQPCSPDRLSRRTAQQVSRWPMSGTEQTEEQNKSEEEQKMNPPNNYKLQANNTDDNRTKSKFPPGSLPSSEEESLAEVDLEKYMAVVDSLKIHEDWSGEGQNNENEKKLKIENGLFLEYLDELCSDENFVRETGSTLNAEYLDFLLSSDPELIDLPMKKQEQEVGSTLNTEYLNPPLSSGPDPIDLVLREILEVFQQKISYQSPADSSCVTPVTEETSPGTSRVEETAPLSNAQSPNLDPPRSRSDTNPNHDGHNPPLSNKGPKEGRSSCSPLLPSLLLEEALPTDATLKYNNPVNATSPLNLNGSLTSPQQMLANLSPGPSLTSDLEARDNDALVEVPAATGDESEEALTSLSNLGDTQSAQASQTLQEEPLAVDPPASESPSTSGVSGSNEDPCTIVTTDHGPSFRADLLTVGLPHPAGPLALTVLALKTLPCPLPQIRISEEKCSPKNIYPKSCRLAATAVPANSPFLADSYANSCYPPVDISDSAPEKQTVEPPKESQLSEDLASSELRETAATQKQTASRKVGMTKTFERKEENKTKSKETTNIRRSQRLSGKIEKARLSGEFAIEKAEEKKPREKSVKKTAKFTPERNRLVYEKQKRPSSGGRQLFKKEESHFEEWSQATKTADTAEQKKEIGEKEQRQRLTGEMQKLEVEGGEQRKANNPNGSTETGAENPPLTKMSQEEKEMGEKRKEEGIQMSNFVKRRTWSVATEGKVQLQGEIKHSAMERSEMKSSPKREMQEDDKLEVNVKEDATVQEILLVPSPTKRSRNRRDKGESREQANNANNTNSTGCKTNKEDKLSIPKSSLQSPKVQTDTHSTKDSIYSLRSQTVSKRSVHNRLGIQENKAAKATHQPSNPKPTAGVKDESVNVEEAECQLVKSSPTKRYRHECGAAERERETKVNETDKAEIETEMIHLSPMKRKVAEKRGGKHRQRPKAEVDSKKKKGKEGPRDKDGTETSGLPSTISSMKAKDGQISNASAGQDTFKCNRNQNKTSIKTLPCAKQTRKRQLDKEDTAKLP